MNETPLILACDPGNDLWRVLTAAGVETLRCAAGVETLRCNSAAEAVGQAPAGAGVLVLAGGYPEQATQITPGVFDDAMRKRLRLYVEFPAALPEIECGQPRDTNWERAVVSSGFFGPELSRLRILAMHGCRFVPVRAADPHLVAARVAGFDSAVYGLPAETWPILCEHPRAGLLVATSKLSQFLTARYAPTARGDRLGGPGRLRPAQVQRGIRNKRGDAHAGQRRRAGRHVVHHQLRLPGAGRGRLRHGRSMLPRRPRPSGRFPLPHPGRLRRPSRTERRLVSRVRLPFDFGRWEYWASNADSGWGAWCIETGWTQAWIVTVLTMRQLGTSLWDLTADSSIGRQLAGIRPEMIPDEYLDRPQ